jgi:hypothetical protein
MLRADDVRAGSGGPGAERNHPRQLLLSKGPRPIDPVQRQPLLSGSHLHAERISRGNMQLIALRASPG